jgi:hypothetical protein
MAQLRRRLYRGRPTSDATLKRLREYARDHRDDPRPSLLLAQAYFQRSWFSDALERYELVYELSPEARGDPRMLENLIRLTGKPAVSKDAADAVVEIYGEEAREAVERALRAPGVDSSATRELERLRQRLDA